MTKICNKNIIILIILTIYSYSFINTQTIIEPINNIINHKKEIVTLEDIKIYKNYNSDNHSPKNIIKFIIKKNVPFIILSIIANTCLLKSSNFSLISLSRHSVATGLMGGFGSNVSGLVSVPICLSIIIFTI